MFAASDFQMARKFLYLLIGMILVIDATRLFANLNNGNQDFVIFPITARAAIAGENPYLPLPELAHRFGSIPLERLPHPTPYPPPALFLGLVFNWVSDAHALAAWLVIGVLCLFTSLLLIHRTLGSANVALAMLLFAVWHPVFLDLGYGQVMIPMLLLTVLAWRYLRAGKDIAGGLFIGLLLAFKLFAWPVALWLLFRKRWSAVVVAVSVVVIGHIAAALWIGLTPIAQYYLHVGKEVAEAYRYDFANFSPMTIGTRLFEGRQGSDLTVLPVVYAPALAGPVSFLAMAAILTWGMITALRSKTFDCAFAALVCLSLIVNPVAWRHYLVVLAIPVALIASRLHKDLSMSRAALLIVIVLVGLSMGHIYQLIADMLGRSSPVGVIVPAVGGVLGLLPLLFVLTVLRLVALDNGDFVLRR